METPSNLTDFLSSNFDFNKKEIKHTIIRKNKNGEKCELNFVMSQIDTKEFSIILLIGRLLSGDISDYDKISEITKTVVKTLSKYIISPDLDNIELRDSYKYSNEKEPITREKLLLRMLNTKEIIQLLEKWFDESSNYKTDYENELEKQIKN